MRYEVSSVGPIRAGYVAARFLTFVAVLAASAALMLTLIGAAALLVLYVVFR